MATSQCTICDMDRQQCQCPRQTSTRVMEPLEMTPAFCCGCYSFSFVLALVLVGVIIHANRVVQGCYLELFANSISLSNANVSNADWRIGFVAKSPITGCKISLHTIKSRLLHGDEVISEFSPSLDIFGQLFTSDESVKFKNVVKPGIIGGVVWNFGVEIVSSVKRDNKDGFLIVFCGNLPVKFTADPAGNMVGSLVGNMRRCHYSFRDKLNPCAFNSSYSLP